MNVSKNFTRSEFFKNILFFENVTKRWFLKQILFQKILKYIFLKIFLGVMFISCKRNTQRCLISYQIYLWILIYLISTKFFENSIKRGFFKKNIFFWKITQNVDLKNFKKNIFLNISTKCRSLKTMFLEIFTKGI